MYSQQVSKILDQQSRLKIADQLLTVLKIHLQQIKNLNCLDIGCSSGVITNYFTDYFKLVVGIDVDESALELAKKQFKKDNLKFLKMSAEDLEFKDCMFDVIICNQIYEFIENDQQLMNEIYRVLKPGGVCLFGARNKWTIMEAQYNLPFLSWLPKSFSDLIVRLTGNGDEFVGHYRGLLGLKQLVNKFLIHDYTLEILRHPERFHYQSLVKYRFLTALMPLEIFYPLIPNYIWVLEKP